MRCASCMEQDSARSPTSWTRLDAARRLHTLADRADAGHYKATPINSRDLAILIREHVTRAD